MGRSPEQIQEILRGLSRADLRVLDEQMQAEAEAYRRAAAEAVNSWHPCADCIRLGGWQPDAPSWEDPRRKGRWPVDGHEHGRPQQMYDWTRFREWVARMGRGTGKTRSAAEDRLHHAWTFPNTVWYIVAPTFADGRDYCFEGASGLVPIAERRGYITRRDRQYNRSTLQLQLDNGSVFLFRAATEPDRLRGPNAHGAWIDEPASMPKGEEVSRQIDMLVRAPLPGGYPTTILWTGTPSRRAFMRLLLARAMAGEIGLRTGTTRDNQANLDPAFIANLLKYEGTEWGRQEIEGLLLASVQGARWKDQWIEDGRVSRLPVAITEVVIAVDPAASVKDTADEVGIITIAKGGDGHGYVIADDTTRGMPDHWSGRVIEVAQRWDRPRADRVRIVMEGNLVGEWFRQTLRQAMQRAGWWCPLDVVYAAERKEIRADPVAMVYAGDRPRIHHVGVFPNLEDEMVTWVPGDPSPNRLDALVWGAHALNLVAVVRADQGQRTNTIPKTATGGFSEHRL